MTWPRRWWLAITVTLAIALISTTRPSAERAQPIAPEVHWLIFIDDLHINFADTGRVRDLLRAISKTLIRDGDAYEVRSSAPEDRAAILDRINDVVRK